MNQLQIIEQNNQRVLTTSQLAESYGTDNKMISYNFNYNKERYKEGKHYFSLTGNEKRDFINHHEIQDGSKNAQTLYLWTEKGAWLHAKSLNTDEAWDAYEMLVDEYYDIKESKIDTSQLSPELQMMNQMYQAMEKNELETKELKQEQEVIKHRIDNIDSLDTVGDLQQRLNAMVRRYAQGKGIAFGLAWREFRVAFNTAYRTNLKALVNNYEEKHNLKKLTTPQYLSLVDRLPDAIRVADKMLNKELV